MNTPNNIPIVVFANRKDFFLTKICVASIRYFYPDIDIYLVKDYLNGPFNTNILSKTFNVKVVDLGKKYFGWSAAKLHFLISDKLPIGKYLTLDSDIIFTGRVLECIADEGDFVVSKEVYELTDIVKGIFLDPDKVENIFSSYTYPGYFFNAGQMVVTLGKIKAAHLAAVFDPNNYPYYLKTKPYELPLVDQGILNAVLPTLAAQNIIELGAVTYMKGSKEYFSESTNNDSSILNQVDKFPFLIHYAGDLRVSDISKMKGANLLSFFQNYYRNKLSVSYKHFDVLQDSLHSINKISKIYYYLNRSLIEVASISKRVIHKKLI